MEDTLDNGRFTYFARHPAELTEELRNTSWGLFDNFFHRIFKSSGNAFFANVASETSMSEIQEFCGCSGQYDKNEKNKEAPATPVGKGEESGLNVEETSQNDNCGVKERKLSSLIAQMFRSRDPTLLDYERSDFRRYWMPDSSGRECYDCQERFTAFRRRHHCRLCGQIFCSKCCGVQAPGYLGDLRLCTYCANVVVSNLPQAEPNVEYAPASPINDQDSTHEVDVPVSTIFAGPVMWSLNSSADSGENGEIELPLYDALPQKSSVKHNPLVQLSVMELAAFESAVHRSFTDEHIDVVDEHEPDWVKNIEMTDHVKRPETSNLKSDCEDYASSIISENVEISLISDVAKSEIGPVMSENPPSKSENENPGFGETIERCFDLQAEKLFLHLFKREGLDPAEWWDIIWTIGHRVSLMVKVDLESRKPNDVMNYAHIKSLHVIDKKPSAKVVEGTTCSKNIRHELMPKEIRNASILTLEGSIEYERVNDKLSSIEQIISQESEYLRNQVERLLSHRPSVVLVERYVSGLAVQMLLNAGVTLVSNIKRRVLQRIARITGADLMPSLDAQILNQKIGFCPLFRQEKIQLLNGNSKCLLVFAECPSELGCSILLRGNSKNDLRAAKRILRYAIRALYSNRLEVELLSSCGTTLTNRCADCVVCSVNAVEPDSNQRSFYNRLKKSTLSPSPLIDFGVPFLETSKGRRCSLRKFFNRFIQSFSHGNGASSRECSNSRTEIYNLSKKPVQHPFVKNVTLTEVDEDAVASFRAFSGRIFQRSVIEHNQKLLRKESKCREKIEDVLDPFAHQQISVLFGSFCAKSPNAPLFCVRPWVVNMEYYGINDMPLGDFLRRYCFNRAYRCPSTNCELPVMEHSRKLVHRNVCIEITTQNYVHFGDECNTGTVLDERNDTLLAWHYCTKCKASSAITPLTENICRLSFASYLNYLANGTYAACDINSVVQKCKHCCFHQHERNFVCNNYVTSFKVIPIRPFHVKFSPLVCTVEHELFSRKFVAESGNEIQHMATTVFGAMSKQIELLSKYSENSSLSMCYAQLIRILKDARYNFSTTLQRFDPSGSLAEEPIPIRSNDAVYTQAVDTACRCKYIIQHAIDLWNEQCQYYMHQIRSFKKSSGNSNIFTVNLGFTTALDDIKETNEITGNEQLLFTNQTQTNGSDCELIQLESPFPVEYHFTLPLPAAGLAAVVVLDMIDRKGIMHPDIGSVIAYALSSVDYDTKRRRQRDLVSNASKENEAEFLTSCEHIEVDFADNRAQYYVKIYYAERFHMLRKLLLVEGEDCFIRSLSSSRSWDPQGGKSGASFYRTQDDRFVFKQMSRFEIQSFVKFGPNYFSYVSTALTDNKLTTLCKVYGVYRICYKNKNNGHQLKVDVLVMEYLFYRRNVKQVWDLKGSQRNRMASEGKGTADLVLLDENLVKDLWNNQLYVHPHSKAALSTAISNDSHFLSAQHVMDYSLLVGVDVTNDELILGIVDYMRTYTLDKKLESWVKIVAVPGAHLPTVISPEMYCRRFSDAIDTYFPVAPDQWIGHNLALYTYC